MASAVKRERKQKLEQSQVSNGTLVRLYYVWPEPQIQPGHTNALLDHQKISSQNLVSLGFHNHSLFQEEVEVWSHFYTNDHLSISSS